MRSLLFAAIDHWRAPAPPPAKVAWLARHTYAHRGLHGAGLPENSRGAFAAAVAKGFGIECDVQRSGDGHAMVFHDWELERLTGASGPVGDLSAAELGKIVLSGSEETIPTLSQTLALVRGKVPILIEVKSRGDRHVNALCLAVRRVLEGYRGPHAVMSFDPRVSRWFAIHSPHTVRGLVMTEENARTVGGRLRRRLALWHAQPDFLAYDVRDLPSAFPEAQRKRGLPVLTWTVRNAELAGRAGDYADAPIAEGAGLEGAA
ncbi:glycerophosphodiester phosphodiesterase [Croceicoccus estronivorus]|uniref:glycerophosphodiester phosphodiesterase family protein n=1 Tax=Croceicoccus estronivorus TaxID=1172626 RepID=UPI00082B3570|nr:glycerophosphodiester phosphodiesterase family protein [Croceicoccus estronivorus]OCC24259.1 glycerophosphodiester phosphodiesterase [Croceicoccus estronivorus]